MKMWMMEENNQKMEGEEVEESMWWNSNKFDDCVQMCGGYIDLLLATIPVCIIYC